MKKNKYWFLPKAFGYGFTPYTWEGAIATIGLLSMVFLSAYTNGFFKLDLYEKKGYFPTEFIWRFVYDVIIITTLFILAFKDKVKGGLQWNWSLKRVIELAKEND